jgi:hypothetical protein
VDQVQAGHDVEQLAYQVRRGPNARRCHVDLARVGFGVSDELGNCLGWNRWIHHHKVRQPDDARDWRDVADEIEAELFVERRIDRMCAADQEQRVAVRGCTHDHLRRDIGASTRPVLDDKLLAEPLRQPLTHQTRDDVGRTAWSKADHNAHWPRRISLRPCDLRHGRQRGSARRQMQKISAGKFHFEPPFTSFDYLVGARE